MPPAVRVEGLRALNAALAKADREVRRGVQNGLRQVAEPVRRDAATLAASQIRRMPSSPAWSKMRTGRTRSLVYVAPTQRGSRGKGGRHRPNLAPLLMDRAMQPSLDRHEDGIVREFDALLDRVAHDFN